MAHEDFSRSEEVTVSEPQMTGYQTLREADAALYNRHWLRKWLRIGRISVADLIARDERDKAAGVKTPLELLEEENTNRN